MSDNELISVDFKAKTVLSRQDANKPREKYTATKDVTFKQHVKAMAVTAESLEAQFEQRPVKFVTFIVGEINDEPSCVAIMGDAVTRADMDFIAGCAQGVEVSK